jgi:tetratricopeptide (TPR) repeat protein
MPKARAYDGGHTVFTDHSISRKPGTKHESGSDLSPFFDRPLPESVSRRNLGVAYAGIGALDKAWPLLRTAVQTKPRDAPLYAQVALLLEADGRADQAIEFYRLALEIDAEQDAALARLGLIMAHRGVATEALRLLRRSLHRNPRQPDLRRALAQLE